MYNMHILKQVLLVKFQPDIHFSTSHSISLAAFLIPSLLSYMRQPEQRAGYSLWLHDE
ncbi:hypothetical protein FX988_00627 [Paraglaciecola mesophila]|uniref:Uncharacterized protein n=1 Tax=Paraglaciecola mesophila TaxID=197222 RepID=A0A857JEH1_9ALTE|nr:hypothetical protein FX988_00627 [Paraglaciecola mesophila]